jgi:hypothetical protein
VYFATIMRRHMLEFGDRGAIQGVMMRPPARQPASKRSCDKKMTLEDYLLPVLADPLRMFDSFHLGRRGGVRDTSIDRV